MPEDNKPVDDHGGEGDTGAIGLSSGHIHEEPDSEEILANKEQEMAPNEELNGLASDGNAEANDEESEEEQDDATEEPQGDNSNIVEDEDDDDDDDDDTLDEDEPPKLKYSRLNQLPANFFNRDPVSTCTFHESVFLFATHSGIIHITTPEFTAIRTFKAHRASVLSIYTDGVFFASGSMDGTVVIGAIKDEKDIVAFDFKRPIHAVILEANYAKTRSFISGGMSGKVTYSSKNWLGQRSDIVLDQDHGPIVSIQKIDDLILWMNDLGITIYHISTRQVISVIEKPVDSPRSDLYWPRVHFPEVDRILIAWGNYIWSLRASLRTVDDPHEKLTVSSKSKILPSTATMSFRAVQEKKIEVEHIFKLDCLVSGISSFKDDLWMILTYNPPTRDEEMIEFRCPDLKLINSINGTIEHEEEIGLKNIDGLGLNDYLLGLHLGEKSIRYFIMSARDGVIAQETQLNDRLQWYLDKKMYYKAWEISQHLVLPVKRISYGIQYVDSLMLTEEWETAARSLASVLQLNIEDQDSDAKSTIYSQSGNLNNEDLINEVISQWTIWADIFIKSKHIEELTDVIPHSPKLSLPQRIYTRILEYWITEESPKFNELVGIWETDLYNVKSIQSTLETLLEHDDYNDKLRRTLADLYVKSYEPIKLVQHLIHLQDPNIISFLNNHHILINFVDDIPRILKLRFKGQELEVLPIGELKEKLDDIVEIFVDNRHEIPPATIVKLMSDNHLDFINFFYLQKLALIDEFLTTDFGNERIRLFALYDRSLLLPFLTKYSNYDIDKAIQLCEEVDFTEELVYLLGKIGENKKALTLIITELDDPEKAIKFAKYQNDREAWGILLEYSMTKPKFIQALIECADDQSNSFYDPIDILQRIPPNVMIAGLKSSVTKISINNDLNLILNQLILKIVYKQSEDISAVYKLNKLKGYEIEVDKEEIDRLIKKYETILMYNEPNTVDIKYLGETGLLQDNRLTLHNNSYTSLENKLEHLSIVNDILDRI